LHGGRAAVAVEAKRAAKMLAAALPDEEIEDPRVFSMQSGAL